MYSLHRLMYNLHRFDRQPSPANRAPVPVNRQPSPANRTNNNQDSVVKTKKLSESYKGNTQNLAANFNRQNLANPDENRPRRASPSPTRKDRENLTRKTLKILFFNSNFKKKNFWL